MCAQPGYELLDCDGVPVDPLDNSTSAAPHLLPTPTNQEACDGVTHKTKTKPEATQMQQRTSPQASQQTSPQASQYPPPPPPDAAAEPIYDTTRCRNCSQSLLLAGKPIHLSYRCCVAVCKQCPAVAGEREGCVSFCPLLVSARLDCISSSCDIPQWTAVYVSLRYNPPAVAGITAAAAEEGCCCCWICCCCCCTSRGVVQLPLLVPRILFADYEELSTPSGGEAVLANAFYCFLHFHQITSIREAARGSAGRVVENVWRQPLAEDLRAERLRPTAAGLTQADRCAPNPPGTRPPGRGPAGPPRTR